MVSNTTDLQAARQTCPRLGFLSDFDLNKVLTEDESFANCASMVFEGAHSFHIESNKITGIKSNTQEEILKFDSPISRDQGRPEAINSIIEQ
jgi:hypothetical protein